ncbi:MAG: chromosome segregation protein SMC [Actinobacteria bacterium]|nr:chromosome segregation protein SMC [Actinomycetota bacterium]
MHLKSLTLKGFKSFASSTTFHFEPGVTCVVGPNGSGKSNVVDALAWVMGEQGAKSLRGGKMEDVIFSGTAGRAPLGRAEVALTIDNSDGALPIEYTEVTISRTLFRNGGSEYAINSEPCRLLDVQELLSDSGIGREMHVIVGQGQLDTILQATPEDRRGFIEEAAGVLKHRKRKEKALRKLDAMQANLTRLQDLTAELRRQLKPLGRQAEVARRAVVIQSEVRDARLRIMADDLVQLRGAFAAEIADETALRERQAAVDAQLSALQAEERAAEQQAALDAPRLTAAQETWFALNGLRERFHGLVQLAAERVKHLQPEPEEDSGRDPEQIESDARALRSEEFELGRLVEESREVLATSEAARAAAESAAAAEQRRIAEAERAAADRREGLARLTGQVNAIRSRLEAREAEIERLSVQIAEARQRGASAQQEFQSIEVDVAGLDAGELSLDAEHEAAERELEQADGAVEQLRSREAAAERERAALSARCDALRIGLERKDAGARLVQSADRVAGVLGPLATLIHVDSGAQTAVAAALGDVADAVVVSGVESAIQAVVLLKDEDAGRAALVLADSERPRADRPPIRGAGRPLLEFVHCDELLRPVVDHLLERWALVDDLRTAVDLQHAHPGLSFVTPTGDVLAAGVVHGGSASAPSLLEVQAAYDDTARSLAEVGHELDRLRFDMSAAKARQAKAADGVERALSRLHESDARMAAVAEQLGQLGQVARAAGAEADRLTSARSAAQTAAADDREQLTHLQQRLEAADAAPDEAPEGDRREELSAGAVAARRHEVDARLALRTAEERVAAVSARAQQLERAAAMERQARAAAQHRRERRARELVVTVAVHSGARVALERIDVSVATAGRERTLVERATREREAQVTRVRAALRELAAEADLLKDSVHRDEVARAEQRMRIEQVEDKVLEDFGVDADVLLAEYGPDQPVPPTPPSPGDDVPEVEPEPYPFVRAEQEKRLRAAERDLALLGRVNPLALEEYSAMEERHNFLTEQLDDLRKTREDLLDIVKEVDARVMQVFSEAYAEVEREFESVFARLFPGGEGRLILTDPTDMLNTGIDVEARPPGKKVKRLSLLSGGERSLTAVAFLVALFKARPSPFYVLDEVEAALDEVNLGRLIDIIEELRTSSQLIVITHQKRTMEIADALYGVSMRGDGVTQVIGQRLRDTA